MLLNYVIYYTDVFGNVNNYIKNICDGLVKSLSAPERCCVNSLCHKTLNFCDIMRICVTFINMYLTGITIGSSYGYIHQAIGVP